MDVDIFVSQIFGAESSTRNIGIVRAAINNSNQLHTLRFTLLSGIIVGYTNTHDTFAIYLDLLLVPFSMSSCTREFLFKVVTVYRSQHPSILTGPTNCTSRFSFLLKATFLK